jgi:putative redox protein
VISEQKTFVNQQGLHLDARVDLPKNRDIKAWAIFAHCFTCNKNFKAAAYVSQTLAEHGIGVLRFDFTGLGQSQGVFEETNFSSNITDLLSAARYLSDSRQAPQLLVGHSLGGTAALYAAGQIDSVSAVVTIGSPAEPKHLMRHMAEAKEAIQSQGEAQIMVDGRRFTFNKQFLQDLEKITLEEHVSRLRAALLILHAPQDETVAIENAAAIFKAARHPKSFVALADADHLLSNKADAVYAGTLIAVWASRYLK